MTVLCVNSGAVYADGVAADAAEGGIDYGSIHIFEVSGTGNNFGFSPTTARYPSGLEIRATTGEEFIGKISEGAQITGSLLPVMVGFRLLNLRTDALNLKNSPDVYIRKLFVDAGLVDGIAFNNTINAEDILVNNADDGFLASSIQTSTFINKCTVINSVRFGFAQGVFTNSVDVNSSGQGFFNEDPSSSNNWEHDGTGTHTIVESPPTDIFVDYAGGDWRIKADSSVGAAGAGAFIVDAVEPPAGNDVTVSSQLLSIVSSLSFSKVDNSFNIDVDSALPALISSLSLSKKDNLFDVSVSSELPSLAGIINFSSTKPGNGFSVNSFLPILSSVLSVSKSDPESGFSAQAVLPKLTTLISLTNSVPEFNVALSSALPSLTSSLSMYNGELGIVIGDRNNIDIVVKSRNIDITTTSRNIKAQ